MTRTILFGLAATVIGGCKLSLPDSDERTISTKTKDAPGFFASSESEVRVKSDFYFAVWQQNLETTLANLPASGSVDTDHTPYYGSWYPQVYGGTGVTNQGGALNALQKYDQAFHPGKTVTSDWEKANHSVSQTDPSAGWAGHCNGFSASAQRFKEPQKSVQRGAVTFSPLDIKALLAEMNMSAKFYFLGGNRCDLSQSIKTPAPADRADPLHLTDCDGINPGTFHLTIANWIGIQKHTIIVDIKPREQVWNYPHFSYSANIQPVSLSAAMQLVTATATGTYPFNPSAVSFASVTMKVTHAAAGAAEKLTSTVAVGDRSESDTYSYVLELDSAGNIIGGEWVGLSQQAHPAFVWVALEAVLGDGSSYSSNPNIDPAEVTKLWAESVGQDPSHPTLDIMYPNVPTGWGRFVKFDVAINGFNEGTAFLGSPLAVNLARKSSSIADSTVEVTVDGKLTDTVNASGNGNVSGNMQVVGPGIHTLELRWKKSGNQVDYQKMRFHAL